MTIYEYLFRVSRPKLVNDMNTYLSLKCVNERLRAEKQLTKPKLNQSGGFCFDEPKPRFFREPKLNHYAKY